MGVTLTLAEFQAGVRPRATALKPYEKSAGLNRQTTVIEDAVLAQRILDAVSAIIDAEVTDDCPESVCNEAAILYGAYQSEILRPLGATSFSENRSATSTGGNAEAALDRSASFRGSMGMRASGARALLQKWRILEL